METLEAIAKRKSIRSYTGEKADKTDLDAILRAANEAPVGMGKYENVHLTLIEDEDLLAELDSACAQMFGRPDWHPLYGAPTLILVSSTSDGDELSNVEYSNAAIIVHSMVLAAVDLGVGACHIWGAIRAVSGNPDIVAKFHLPEGFTPCCAVALGKTDEKYEERESPDGRIAMNEVR